jgi:hypothetical protein
VQGIFDYFKSYAKSFTATGQLIGNFGMEKVYISADFKIGDAWELARPNSYEVLLSDPLMKGGLDLPDFLQHVSIIVSLQQAGFIDWVQSKAYDELWSYLKAYFQVIPRGSQGVTAEIKVKDKEGNLRLAISGINPEDMKNVELEIREKCKADPDGSVVSESTLRVSLNKSSDRE